MDKSKFKSKRDLRQLGHVVIITSEPFPHGFAPANRIKAYAEGFIDNNYTCEVVIIKPNNEKNNKGFASDDFFEGIKYKFPGNIISVNEDNIFIRQIQYQYSVIKSLLYVLFNYVVKSKADIIIYYGTDLFIELQLTILCDLFNVVILKEQSERPLLYNTEKLVPMKIVKLLYDNVIFKRYDGILAMTLPIRDYFIGIGVPVSKIMITHHTVSLKRFDRSLVNKVNQYFAYTGSLNEQKDGVLGLLEALAIVKQEFTRVELKVAGYGSIADLEMLKWKIKNLGIEKNVSYLGRLNSKDTIDLIKNATALMSFRPNSIQAEYGFPTKVVEYLATGNPVITTLTGDLRLFLINKENSFTTLPGDIKGFAKQWITVLRDLDNAKKVGAQGKQLVINVFNPKIQTSRVISYYLNLKH